MKCNASKCKKSEKKNPRFNCITCQKSFCSWHLCFLDGDIAHPITHEAQCICCILGIERTPDFADPGIADELAIALKEKGDMKFSLLVLQYRRDYERAEEAAFDDRTGPGCWYPTMAPPLIKEVKDFIRANQTRPC